MLFINVFAVNLYEFDVVNGLEVDHHDSIVNGTGFGGKLLEQQAEDVQLHTSFYIFFLAANCVSMYFHLTVLKTIHKGKSPVPWVIFTVSSLLIITVGGSVTFMTLIDPDFSYWQNQDGSIIQFCVWINDNFKTGWWHWMPILFYRYRLVLLLLEVLFGIWTIALILLLLFVIFFCSKLMVSFVLCCCLCCSLVCNLLFDCVRRL